MEFTNPLLSDIIKDVLTSTDLSSKCAVYFLESNKEHINPLIETILGINILALVNKLKSRPTYLVWKLCQNEIRKFYW